MVILKTDNLRFSSICCPPKERLFFDRRRHGGIGFGFRSAIFRGAFVFADLCPFCGNVPSDHGDAGGYCGGMSITLKQ